LNYDKFFESKLTDLKDEGLYRTFREIDRHQNLFPKALEYNRGKNREVEIWCSNDYLNMSQHPEVMQTCIDVINELGTGSGGTRNISGTSSYHVGLERCLAELHRKESALVFPSAYTANQSTISILCKNIENIEKDTFSEKEFFSDICFSSEILKSHIDPKLGINPSFCIIFSLFNHSPLIDSKVFIASYLMFSLE